MITFNGWCAGGKGGGGRKMCRWVSVQSMGEMGIHFCPNFLQPFLKNIHRRCCDDGRRNLFQYFTTLTENADPLLRRLLAPWSTLLECLLRPRRAGGRKNKFGSISTSSSDQYQYASVICWLQLTACLCGAAFIADAIPLSFAYNCCPELYLFQPIYFRKTIYLIVPRGIYFAA